MGITIMLGIIFPLYRSWRDNSKSQPRFSSGNSVTDFNGL